MKKQSRTVPHRRQSVSPTPRHLPLVDILIDTQAELQELVVASGLKVLEAMLEDDRVAVCGPRYAHQPERQAYRAGHAPSQVVLGGRKVAIRRPRARRAGTEVPLPTVRAFTDADPLNRRVVDQMLIGVATRQYARSSTPRSWEGRRHAPTAVAAVRDVVQRRDATPAVYNVTSMVRNVYENTFLSLVRLASTVIGAFGGRISGLHCPRGDRGRHCPLAPYDPKSRTWQAAHPPDCWQHRGRSHHDGRADRSTRVGGASVNMLSSQLGALGLLGVFGCPAAAGVRHSHCPRGDRGRHCPLGRYSRHDPREPPAHSARQPSSRRIPLTLAHRGRSHQTTHVLSVPERATGPPGWAAASAGPTCCHPS